MFNFKALLLFAVFLLYGCTCSAQTLCVDRYKVFNGMLEEQLASKNINNDDLRKILINARKDKDFNSCVELNYLAIDVHLYTGENKKALYVAKQTLDVDQNNAHSHVYASFVYQSLGDSEMAISHMRKAYELMPSNSFIKINYCSTLSNYGYIDKAKSICK